VKPHRLRKRFPACGLALPPPIFNKRRESVAVFSNQPDSLRAGGVRCVANAANSVVTAFPDGQGRRSNPAQAETRPSMLPGFRFLFAAIILSMSILVFGLGAAALLRAAHDQFSINPSWHPTPETMFAQQGEATRPVLAMLRVEPPAVEQKAPDNVPAVAAPTSGSAPAEPAASAAAPAGSERIAALKPEDPSPRETAKPEIPAAESSAPSEAAPAQTDAPAPADETKIAAAEQVVPPATEAAPAASEQISAPPSPDTDAASTKIATLGGPAVTIETPPPANAKPDRSVIKKRLQARRAVQRRRMAARARVAAARLAAQQLADPFAQPTTQPATAVRSR
jgi:hypothetical protein